MKFDCPHCSQSIDAPDELAGTDTNCPTCEGAISVPQKPNKKLPRLSEEPLQKKQQRDMEDPKSETNRLKKIAKKGKGAAAPVPPLSTVLGGFIILIIVAVIAGLIFPLAFYGVSAFAIYIGFSGGVELWKAKNYVNSLLLIILTALTLGTAGYFFLQAILKPTDPINWEDERKAEEWLSNPVNREHYNKHMRGKR